MNLYCSFFLVLTSVIVTTSSDVSVKGDLCSKFDSCLSKSQQRTCRCTEDCQAYGTCCHDIIGYTSHSSSLPFLCYHQRTMTPVFVKRSCPDGYRGHLKDVEACFNDDEDEMDIANNLLVTSHRTKITYWNSFCAVCNEESEDDLELWSIEVFCPSREQVDRWLIRSNLTFDENRKQWGLNIGGEFLQCVVKYTSPPYIDEVKHCTPNLISDCPANYTKKRIVKKCSKYYGERKLRNSDTFYKNVHCAICNGVNIKDLECPGMRKPENDVEETDFREMVEEIFTNGKWLDKAEGQRYLCSEGFSYDPFWEKCRRFEKKASMLVMNSESNSAQTLRLGLSSGLIVLLLFL